MGDVQVAYISSCDCTIHQLTSGLARLYLASTLRFASDNRADIAFSSQGDRDTILEGIIWKELHFPVGH